MVTKIARPLKNNIIRLTNSLEINQARFFLEVRTFKYVRSIKVNPVKTGDAKPRVFRHALHGNDSQVAEIKLLMWHVVSCYHN